MTEALDKGEIEATEVPEIRQKELGECVDHLNEMRTKYPSSFALQTDCMVSAETWYGGIECRELRDTQDPTVQIEYGRAAVDALVRGAEAYFSVSHVPPHEDGPAHACPNNGDQQGTAGPLRRNVADVPTSFGEVLAVPGTSNPRHFTWLPDSPPKKVHLV